MKKLLTLTALSLLILSGCTSPTKAPATTGETRENAPEVAEIETPEEQEGYTLGQYTVNFEVPAGLMVSSPKYPAEGMATLFVDDEDWNGMEGDGSFMVHNIQYYEDGSIENWMNGHQDTEPLTIELAGTKYERVLFYSFFGEYQGVAYLKEMDGGLLVFSPAADTDEVPNSASDLVMIELIKSFEILSSE